MNARHPAKRRPLPHLLPAHEGDDVRGEAAYVAGRHCGSSRGQRPPGRGVLQCVVHQLVVFHHGIVPLTLFSGDCGARRFCSPLWGLGELFLRFGPRGFGVALRVAKMLCLLPPLLPPRLAFETFRGPEGVFWVGFLETGKGDPKKYSEGRLELPLVSAPAKTPSRYSKRCGLANSPQKRHAK